MPCLVAQQGMTVKRKRFANSFFLPAACRDNVLNPFKAAVAHRFATLEDCSCTPCTALLGLQLYTAHKPCRANLSSDLGDRPLKFYVLSPQYGTTVCIDRVSTCDNIVQIVSEPSFSKACFQGGHTTNRGRRDISIWPHRSGFTPYLTTCTIFVRGGVPYFHSACGSFQGCSRVGSNLARQVGSSQVGEARPDSTRPDPT